MDTTTTIIEKLSEIAHELKTVNEELNWVQERSFAKCVLERLDEIDDALGWARASPRANRCPTLTSLSQSAGATPAARFSGVSNAPDRSTDWVSPPPTFT